jgi:hypothetical protein
MSAYFRNHNTSLEALQHEDAILRGLFDRITESRGSSVEARYDYGNAAKQIIRHVASRQASLMDIATSTEITAVERQPTGRSRNGYVANPVSEVRSEPDIQGIGTIAKTIVQRCRDQSPECCTVLITAAPAGQF